MGALKKISTMSIALLLCATIIYVTTQDRPYLESLLNFHKSFWFKTSVLIACLGAIAILVPIIVRRLKENIAKLHRPIKESPAKQYVVRRSLQEYNREAREYTEKCVKELMSSEAYKKTLQAKGQDKAKWNWQTRETKYGEVDEVEEDS